MRFVFESDHTRCEMRIACVYEFSETDWVKQLESDSKINSNSNLQSILIIADAKVVPHENGDERHIGRLSQYIDRSSEYNA